MDMFVSVGDRVRWVNNGVQPHTTTSGGQPTPDGVWDSSLLQPGQAFTRTFNTPGSFSYFCVLHTGQLGSVTVQP
jgi:plastocyanin